MIQLSFDPDYTGFAVPLVPGAPIAYWQLTREQWYLIARCLLREAIRLHYEWDPARNTDPDQAELTAIAYKTRQLLSEMRSDPTQTWSRIAWGQRIVWAEVACYGRYRAENPPAVQYPFYRNISCSVAWQDLAYSSGLAVHGASLDPIQPYGDPVNEQRYEQACDGIWYDLFSSHSLSSNQSITLGGAPEAGSGYSKPKPAPSTSTPAGGAAAPGESKGPGAGMIVGAVAVVGGAIAAIALAAAKLFRRR